MSTHDDIRAALEAATRAPLSAFEDRDGAGLYREDTGVTVFTCKPGYHRDAVLFSHARAWLAELLTEVDHWKGYRVEVEFQKRRADAAERRLDVIHQLAQGIADAYGDDWPHIGGCQGDAGDSGCPLCRILALSAEA